MLQIDGVSYLLSGLQQPGTARRFTNIPASGVYGLLGPNSRRRLRFLTHGLLTA
ncbi:MAG: hypothetical protein IPJ50_18030 [Betaproteobacteria bacterium]|nr:hypothetical protein [Betaproteobacteria bacterium]